MTFTRRKENFECAQCGAQVVGDGYTNHCPRCLWSKHVDVDPGDRAATCQGMMQPIGVRMKDGVYDIEHRCVACGKKMFCRASPQDDFEMIVKVSTSPLSF